jgi:hypothetical protein
MAVIGAPAGKSKHCSRMVGLHEGLLKVVLGRFDAFGVREPKINVQYLPIEYPQ